jgi:hypothetical protein
MHRFIGDGNNRLVDAGRLDQRAPSTITALTRVSDGPPIEYELAATGGQSEHYAPLQLNPSAAGPYALTMQVKPVNNSRLRLQMLDNGGNAAFADFNFARKGVKTTRLGRTQGQKATMTADGDGWYTLTLRAVLPDDGAYVIVQPVAASGEVAFEPAGEAIRFRRLGVEGGRLHDGKSTDARK